MLCATAYFENFHPNFPVLHRPTFSLRTAPKALGSIVVAIGNLYRCRIDPTIEVGAAHAQSNELWDATVTSLRGKVCHQILTPIWSAFSN